MGRYYNNATLLLFVAVVLLAFMFNLLVWILAYLLFTVIKNVFFKQAVYLEELVSNLALSFL